MFVHVQNFHAIPSLLLTHIVVLCVAFFLQRIPLRFDEEQGLWIIVRELPVSVFYHSKSMCHFFCLRGVKAFDSSS